MTLAVGQLYADFSSSKPSNAQLQAAGYSGVIGYVSTPDDQSGNGKNISTAQVTNYHNSGFDVLLVWETTAQRALGGAPAGTTDGAAAFSQARGRGLPLTSVLFFNCGDFAATTAQIPVIAQYLAAAIAQCPGQLVGAYGTGYIIDQLAGQFPSVIWWQNAMNDEGEAGSTVSHNAYLYQRVTPTHPIPGTDENVVTRVWTVTPPDPPENDMEDSDGSVATLQVGNLIHVWRCVSGNHVHNWQTVGGNQPIGGVAQPNWYAEWMPLPAGPPPTLPT